MVSRGECLLFLLFCALPRKGHWRVLSSVFGNLLSLQWRNLAAGDFYPLAFQVISGSLLFLLGGIASYAVFFSVISAQRVFILFSR